MYGTYVTRPAKINHVSAKYANFCLSSINKMSIINAKFNGHSSAIYTRGTLNLHVELKIII